jgi:hypothetical protein
MVHLRGLERDRILFVFLLIISLFALSACSSDCAPVASRYYERQEYMNTKLVERTETYTYAEPVAKKTCVNVAAPAINVTRFIFDTPDYSIQLGDKDWIYDPLVVGESNLLRQTLFFTNKHAEKSIYYMDKVFLINGTEVNRWERSALYEVSGSATRRFFVTWDTEYDPGKDVFMQVANETRVGGVAFSPTQECTTVTEEVEKTGTRKVTDSVDTYAGYVPIIKERKRNVCG